MKPGAKRFYKTVDVREAEGAFTILLDGRSIKTPAMKPLRAPTRGLAQGIAAEWEAQTTDIVPDTMPLTKALNTALDRVGPSRAVIIDELAKYAGSDLLCYRADAPGELVRRQAAAWDPWLAWAADRFGVHLKTTTGIVHVEQSPETLARIRDAVAAHDDLHLVPLGDAVSITGSAILGLAFAARALDAEGAFVPASIDADFQAERWGRDAEAEAVRARRLSELEAAERFLRLIAA